MIEKITSNIARTSFETALLIVLGLVFFEGVYEGFSNPIQLVLLKVLLVSLGVYHAHLTGKFFIPQKVDWSQKITEQTGAFYVRSILYAIIPICYSIGG